MYIRTLTAK